MEFLPDSGLRAQVDVARVVGLLVELELVGEVGALDLAVQVRAPRPNVDVARAELFDVPVELRLRLVPVEFPSPVNP